MCLYGWYEIILIANNTLKQHNLEKKKDTLEKNIFCCNLVNAKASINNIQNAY